MLRNLSPKARRLTASETVKKKDRSARVVKQLAQEAENQKRPAVKRKGCSRLKG